MSEAPDTPTWSDLRVLLRWAAALFGEPVELLEAQVVERRQGLALRGWLRALEAIARALLVLLAAGLPTPDPQRSSSGPRRPGASPTADAKSPNAPSTDDEAEASSERWAGVTFRVVPPTWRAPGPHARTAPARFVWTRLLALRFEALIRVAEAPERYARRLARRLHAAPALGIRVLRPLALTASEGFPRDDVAHAQAHAHLALERLAPAPPNPP